MAPHSLQLAQMGFDGIWPLGVMRASYALAPICLIVALVLVSGAILISLRLLRRSAQLIRFADDAGTTSAACRP